MDNDNELIDSIKAMQAIHEEMQSAVTSGLAFDWQDAFERKRMAEIRHEKAVLEMGWMPAYPPKTPEGERRWGLTDEQAQEIREYFGL